MGRAFVWAGIFNHGLINDVGVPLWRSPVGQAGVAEYTMRAGGEQFLRFGGVVYGEYIDAKAGGGDVMNYPPTGVAPAVEVDGGGFFEQRKNMAVGAVAVQGARQMGQQPPRRLQHGRAKTGQDNLRRGLVGEGAGGGAEGGLLRARHWLEFRRQREVATLHQGAGGCQRRHTFLVMLGKTRRHRQFSQAGGTLAGNAEIYAAASPKGGIMR